MKIQKTKSFLCCSSLYIFSLKSLEGSNINMGNQGIQFVGGVLVFVTHTCKANSASEGDISEKEIKKICENERFHQSYKVLSLLEACFDLI